MFIADLPSIIMAQCRSRHGRADSGRWEMLPNHVARVLDGRTGHHRYTRAQYALERSPMEATMPKERRASGARGCPRRATASAHPGAHRANSLQMAKAGFAKFRSEERRVGKECRSRWS